MEVKLKVTRLLAYKKNIALISEVRYELNGISTFMGGPLIGNSLMPQEKDLILTFN